MGKKPNMAVNFSVVVKWKKKSDLELDKTAFTGKKEVISNMYRALYTINSGVTNIC